MDLNSMKKYCMQVDMACEVGTEKEIECYYEDIAFEKLLHIYIQYNGLKCYQQEEPEDYKNFYSIDLITLLKILTKTK
jgi:hypothetical protein|tara:strand:- start:145 stop:378 length:234 start_codon:yes stop_codon:yes gene_type:complete